MLTAKSFFISTILRSATIISGFCIFLLSSFLYGPEGRGVFSFLSAFYVSGALIASLGLGRVAYQEIKNVSHEAVVLTRMLFLYSIASALVLLVPLFLFYAFSNEFFENYHFTQFFAFYGILPFYIWQNFSNYLYSALGKTALHDRVIFVSRFGQLALLAISASIFHLSLEKFLFLYGSSCFTVFIFEYFVLAKHQNLLPQPSVPYGQLLMSLIKKARWPFLDSLALATPPLAIFILGLYVSREELGYFSFALQILAALYFPFTVMQVKIQEKMKPNPKDVPQTLLKNSRLIVAPVSGALIGAALIVIEVIPHTPLDDFAKSTQVLFTLLLTIPLAGAHAASQGILIGIHRPKISSLSNLTGGALNLAIVVLLGSTIGTKAGILGIYASYISAIAAQLVAFRRIHKQLKLSQNPQN